MEDLSSPDDLVDGGSDAPDDLVVPDDIINDGTYDPDKVTSIRLVLFFFVILWIFVIVYLELYHTDFLGALILSLPFFIFFIACISAPYLDEKTEEKLYEINFLTVGLMIVIPLLTWMAKDKHKDKHKFVTISVVAIIFAIFSLIDIWVPKYYISVVRHIKSSFEVLAGILIIYAIYDYYLEHIDKMFT